MGCELQKIQEVAQGGPLQKRLAHTQSQALQVKYIDQLVKQSEQLLLEEQKGPHGWPLPPIGVVALYERHLCQLSRDQRNTRLSSLQSEASFSNAFESLLLASCEPDFTPSVLARSLKQVNGYREWPESYLAYFNLLERHLQALSRLEKLYGNLKEKMDTTIEKLTEIEVETQP